MAGCVWPDWWNSQQMRMLYARADATHLCELLSFWQRSIDFLGVVAIRFDDRSVRHARGGGSSIDGGTQYLC